MDIVNILANLTNKGQAANFLQEQQVFLEDVNAAKIIEDARYYNPATPFADAQKIADNYKLFKRRVPMTIEYYKRKPDGSNDKDAIESIEMYINPNRLQITNNKLKQKAYTRGGIFYHQWGDDHPSMQITGVTGLSGMRGIETLEKIYYNSGAILHYQNVGVTKIGGSNAKYVTISNNINDIAQNMVNGTVTNQQMMDALNEQQKNQTFNSEKVLIDIKKYITNNIDNLKNNSSFNIFMVDTVNKLNERYNQQLNLNSTTPSYQKLQEYVKFLINSTPSEPMKSMEDKLKTQVIKELVDSFLNQKSIVVEGLIGGLIDTISQKSAEDVSNYIQVVNKLNERSKIDKTIAFTGWNDIADEVIDEWRPRIIFIYFEDRVYMGHFMNFNYTRTADSMLINYDMKFDIIRQIIVTSTASDKSPSTSTIGSEISLTDPMVTNQIYDSIEPVMLTASDFWGDMNFFRTAPINAIKIKILIFKEILVLNDSITKFAEQDANHLFPRAGILSENDISIIKGNLELLRWYSTNQNITEGGHNANTGQITYNPGAPIPEDDPLYGINLLTADQVLWFFVLAKYNNIIPGIDTTNLYYALNEEFRIYIQGQVRNLVYMELQRSQNVYNFLGSTNQLTIEKATGIYEWVKKVRAASGIIDNLWEDEILTYIYGNNNAILGIPQIIIINADYGFVNFKINSIPHATSYRVSIYQGTNLISSLDYLADIDNTIDNLKNNTEYTFQVYAIDSTNNYKNSIVSYSNFITLILPIPLPPTSPHVSKGAGCSFNINFTRGIGATHTDIDFSKDNENWDANIEYPNQPGTSYTNISLPQYGTWYFRLRSKNYINDNNYTTSIDPEWVITESLIIVNSIPIPPPIIVPKPYDIVIEQLTSELSVNITFKRDALKTYNVEIQSSFNTKNNWGKSIYTPDLFSNDMYLGSYGLWYFRIRCLNNNTYPSDWVEIPKTIFANIENITLNVEESYILSLNKYYVFFTYNYPTSQFKFKHIQIIYNGKLMAPWTENTDNSSKPYEVIPGNYEFRATIEDLLTKEEIYSNIVKTTIVS